MFGVAGADEVLASTGGFCLTGGAPLALFNLAPPRIAERSAPLPAIAPPAAGGGGGPGGWGGGGRPPGGGGGGGPPPPEIGGGPGGGGGPPNPPAGLLAKSSSSCLILASSASTWEVASVALASAAATLSDRKSVV